MSDREERLAAENEMRAADYLRLCKEFDKLTAERDALREIVDHMTKHGVPPEHSYEVLRADNERLRAEVAPNWKQGYANMADGVLALEAQLTELREATEAHVRVCPSLDGRTWLEDVLAKVTP